MSEHKTALVEPSEIFRGRKLFVDQRMEHGLCLVWQQFEKDTHGMSIIRDILRKEVDPTLFEDMVKAHHLRVNGDEVELTAESHQVALDIIRRRRLAERLLEDVLDVSRDEVETQACEMEHIIDKNVEEHICTLLGHPRECPHGLPIPKGNCCKELNMTVESIVTPLNHFKSGEKGKVAYILTRNHPQLHKLLSLGIVPGTLLSVHQTFPSYIIQVEETQLALEEIVAENIYLRKLE